MRKGEIVGAWGLTAPNPTIFQLPLPRKNRTHILGVAGWPQKIVPRAGCPRRLTADLVDPSRHPSINPSLLCRPNDGLGRRSPQILSVVPRAGTRPPGSRGLTQAPAGWPRAGTPLHPDKLHLARPSAGPLPSRSAQPAENSIENQRAMGRTCQGLPPKAGRPSQLRGLLLGI